MIKVLISILFSVNIFSFVLADGPYDVDWLYESDGLRNGPHYTGATLYYPIATPEHFASIVIVPGWGMPESSIQDWGPFFASWGIIAMTIGTNNPSTDWPEDRAEALLDAIETIKQENDRIDSPVNGKIDLNSFAVSGWSMGGGGAQLAAVMEPTLKAVIALCPWLDNGVLEPVDLSHSVPTLIFSGQYDINAPPYLHANIHYSYIPATTDKLLFEVENGDHFVANGPDGGGGYVGDRALEWLKNYLLEDSSNCELLLAVPPTASQYLTNVECQPVIQGDLNGDGVIDILDIIVLVNIILADEYNSIADLNEDGELNILDVVIMVNLVLYDEPSICDGLTEVELLGEWYDIGTTDSLNLNGLTGSIPPEIGCLTNLEFLSLFNFTGEIPPEIGNLTNLEVLGLHSNQLTGGIPPEIGNLTSLTQLSLQYNQLSGEIPSWIGNLTNLTYLDLSYNASTGGLSGEIPVEIRNLTNLTFLSLQSNQLTGEIPSWIGQLINLEVLFLYSNYLTGEIPPEIGSLTNLSSLVLSNNQLTGEIPQEVCDLIESNNWISSWSFEGSILAGNNLINTCQ
jgi:pimeloyl-ACP methyl ester carboxylesterase